MTTPTLLLLIGDLLHGFPVPANSELINLKGKIFSFFIKLSKGSKRVCRLKIGKFMKEGYLYERVGA